MQRWITAITMAAALFTASIAQADDIAVLKAENAELKAKVAKLEAELKIAKAKLGETVAERDDLAQKQEKAQTEKREYYIAKDYDAEAKRTTLTGRASSLKITRGAKFRHWLNVTAGYAGEKPATPVEQIQMVVRTSFSGQQYNRVKQITLVADGKTHTLDVASYDNVFRTSGSPRTRKRKDDETLTVTVPIATAKAIGRAKTVTGRMGHNDFQLSREQRESFAVMVQTLEAE